MIGFLLGISLTINGMLFFILVMVIKIPELVRNIKTYKIQGEIVNQEEFKDFMESKRL